MTKKPKKPKKIKLKDAIQELELPQSEEVFIHIYLKPDKEYVTTVFELDDKTLNRRVLKIQSRFGGQDYGYSKYRFILE